MQKRVRCSLCIRCADNEPRLSECDVDIVDVQVEGRQSASEHCRQTCRYQSVSSCRQTTFINQHHCTQRTSYHIMTYTPAYTENPDFMNFILYIHQVYWIFKMPLNYIMKFSNLILTKNYDHTSQKQWTTTSQTQISDISSSSSVIVGVGKASIPTS